MAYEKHTFASGDVLKAATMQEMDDEISALDANKVDAEDGKGLSSNDYTDEEKEKLAGLTQVDIDTTLAVSGAAADAKTVGDKLAEKQAALKDSDKQAIADMSGLNGSEDADSDLDICDAEGRVIARFSNGNIKTKNFSSADQDVTQIYTPIKKFAGKKIAIVGDSISTFNGYLPSDIDGYDGTAYATYYPQGNVASVEDTWWYLMAQELGLTLDNISNVSWSGSRVTGSSTSTTTAYAACSDRRISDITLRFGGESPDIIICYISCNDWGNNIAIGDWNIDDAIPDEGTISTLRSAYALMLNKLNLAYPNARIFCCTNLDDLKRDSESGYPSTNTSGVSVNKWNSNIIEVAEALGCDVIDLHSCGIKYSNISSLVVDTGLHPNAAGHKMMARKIVSELIAKY